jgi:simple sugar transport system substrate-binding protein
MKRRLFKILVIAFITAIIFIGCEGAKTTETGEEKKTTLFSDITIVFFPGGNEGCPFASVVYRGAKDAEEILGCTVNYVWSDWLPDKMVAQFKDAIAMHPDGICIMGHPGVVAFAPLVDEAIDEGIIVTSQNTSLPSIEQKYILDGFGYVGQELYESGIMLGRSAGEFAGLKAGDLAMVWGLLGQETRGLRTKGCIDALEDMGVKVDYIEITDAINSDASLGTPVITAYIANNPDVKLIITDHGALTSTLGTYLKAAGLEPGDVFGAGFDLSAATADAIKEGWVGAVLDQQPYLQGFLPILQVCLTKVYGFSGLHIDTGAAIIHKGNIDFIAPLAVEGIR